MIQLAKKLTGLTVVASASRDDTVDWVKKMGADHVVNHRNPLNEEMASLSIAPKYVAALTGTDGHWDAIIEMMKPRGHIGMIDDPAEIRAEVKRWNSARHIRIHCVSLGGEQPLLKHLSADSGGTFSKAD